MRTAVVTLARGRRRHLERQAYAVARLDPAPDDYVVVDLEPPFQGGRPPGTLGARVVRRPVPDGTPLPLAAARNAGIATAAERAELVICLDVDCVPEPGLIARMTAAARRDDGLLAGPVGRLPALPAGRLQPTPAELRASRAAARSGPRPVPRAGELVAEARVELFWSLAFAVTPATHARIGGFDEAYAGYGAEDTDYAFRARRAGVGLAWVGGAWAHHQHHPVSDPPVEHLRDIVRNARRFHARWGRWPMEGWLRAFANLGLIEWSGAQLTLAVSRPDLQGSATA